MTEESAASGPLLLLQRLRKCQERRPGVYHELDVAFKALVQSGDLDAYVEATKSITKQFSDISAEIRLIEEELKALSPPVPYAGKIRELQELEREKLSMTSQIQILRKEHKDHKEHKCEHHGHQHHNTGFEDAEFERNHDNLMLQMHSIVEKINSILEDLRMEEVELMS